MIKEFVHALVFNTRIKWSKIFFNTRLLYINPTSCQTSKPSLWAWKTINPNSCQKAKKRIPLHARPQNLRFEPEKRLILLHARRPKNVKTFALSLKNEQRFLHALSSIQDCFICPTSCQKAKKPQNLCFEPEKRETYLYGFFKFLLINCERSTTWGFL